MFFLAQLYKITELKAISYDHNTRTHTEVARIFHEIFVHLPLISQKTFSKTEKQFRKFEHIGKIKKHLSRQ